MFYFFTDLSPLPTLLLGVAEIGFRVRRNFKRRRALVNLFVLLLILVYNIMLCVCIKYIHHTCSPLYININYNINILNYIDRHTQNLDTDACSYMI